MKNLNSSKLRFICIFLAFSRVISGYFFRNQYSYQFLGLAYICIAISNICLYLFELKEKGHSSKSYILGAIMLVILAIFFQGCLDNNKRHAIVCLLFSSLLLYYIKNITFI